MNELSCVQRTAGRATLLLAVLAVLVLVPPAAAHPPADLQISYDNAAAQLAVTITHRVPDPAAHYIREVTIRRNGQEINRTTYRDQPPDATFTYLFPVSAGPGDAIGADAACSIAGSIAGSITVPGAPALTPAEGSGPVPTQSPLAAAPLAVVAAAAAGILGRRAR